LSDHLHNIGLGVETAQLSQIMQDIRNIVSYIISLHY
jgi:hypothetical protein